MASVIGLVHEEGVQVIYRYKYLPFNEGSLQVISEGTFKYTCPLEFNDPFDCIPYFDPDSISAVFDERPDLIQHAANYRNITYQEMLAKKDELVESVRLNVENGDFIFNLLSAAGVLSLSRDPTNILMWSHYASHHRGFVVELRIPMDAPDELLEYVAPLEVVYSETRPTVRWGRVGPQDVTEYFLTKNIDWSYEEEERVVTRHQGAGVHKYSREHFLCSVIAGPKIGSAEFDILKSTVNDASNAINKSIALYKAELSPSLYKVLIPGHPFSKFSG